MFTPHDSARLELKIQFPIDPPGIAGSILGGAARTGPVVVARAVVPARAPFKSIWTLTVPLTACTGTVAPAGCVDRYDGGPLIA